MISGYLRLILVQSVLGKGRFLAVGTQDRKGLRSYSKLSGVMWRYGDVTERFNGVCDFASLADVHRQT